MHYYWGQTAQKKERSHFEQYKSRKKRSPTLRVVSWDNNTAVYIASSKSPELERFAQCLNKG